MELSDYSYNLPAEFIAQKPPLIRGTSKLLVHDRHSGRTLHLRYFNFVNFPQKGDVVVFNDTKVLDARVYAYTEFGAEIELMFIEKVGEDQKKWRILVGNSKRLKNKKKIDVGEKDSGITASVLENLGNGEFLVELSHDGDQIFEEYGHVPLPKYIRREDKQSDRKRYQTVFAKNIGAVAAPTASLNMTKWMIEILKKRGVKIAYVDLRVSWDTFKPVRVEKIKDHEMHSEFIDIDKENADIINSANHVWAIGTTVVRTLESVADKNGKVKPYFGRTKIFIYPGYKFKAVDHMLTNFHAPETTVLMMASAFTGREEILGLYEEAKEKNYKFLSYGDSMLIL